MDLNFNRNNQQAGLTDYLAETAMDLLAVSEDEQDDGARADFYDETYRDLMDHSDRLGRLMTDLDEEEAEEEVWEICGPVDEIFIQTANMHMDAIDMMVEFMETEDPQLIGKITETLGEAAALLEEAEDMVGRLRSLI